MRAIVLFLALFVSLLFFGCTASPSDAYSIQNGHIHYPENRPVPIYNATILVDAANFTLTDLTYQSHGVSVHALLRIPKTYANGTAVSNPPVVMILPGATVPAFARQNLAQPLQEWGYATLALDVRGNGKTPRLHSMDDDYTQFLHGGEPEEAQVAFDVLAGFDVLSAFPVDQNRIVLWGESMGGRYAIIATALEPKIKGLIIVSSAGYGLPQGQDANQTAFLRLIDPDNYVAQIASRPIFFLHNPTDNVIPYASAQFTFQQAGQPKSFTDFTCPPPQLHAYCKEMDSKIKDDLAKIFS